MARILVDDDTFCVYFSNEYTYLFIYSFDKIITMPEYELPSSRVFFACFCKSVFRWKMPTKKNWHPNRFQCTHAIHMRLTNENDIFCLHDFARFVRLFFACSLSFLLFVFFDTHYRLNLHRKNDKSWFSF